MNAPALALTADTLLADASARRHAAVPSRGTLPPQQDNPAPDLLALAQLQDDDLRLEQALAAMRLACRSGDMAGLNRAAEAAMPRRDSADAQLARRSLLRLLTDTRQVPLQRPDENRLYLLRRINGAPIALLRLRDDGSISVSHMGSATQGAAPSHWRLHADALELLHANGRSASRLPISGVQQGLRVYVGESAHEAALHVLAEVRCTYSRLRMLDPELSDAFGALFNTDAMVPVALPERPVVVVATPHTGSTRLLRLLNSCPQVLIDNEIMRPEAIGMAGVDLKAEDAGALLTIRAKDPVYFARVMMARTHHLDGRGLDGVPVRGFVLNPAHTQATLDWALNESAVTMVHLVRDNLLAEYASILAGGPDSPRRARVHFDALRFERFMTMKQRWLQSMRQRLEQRRGAWAEIETAAFTQDNLQQLLHFICPGADEASLPPASLARQRPERVLERFDNPDEVRTTLAALGREDWING